MKLFLSTLLIIVSSPIFFGCNLEQPQPVDTYMEVMSEICNSSGILKKRLHATAHLRDETSWGLIIEDSLRLAEFGTQWQPWLCAELPDSIKEEGLELIISYLDKTTRYHDTALYRLADLLEVKRINDFPLEDPRNGKNMATLYVKKADGTPVNMLAGVVFRNAQEWEQFLSSWEGASASREVNFDTHSVVGEAVSHGGCGWRYERRFDPRGTDTLVFTIKAMIYGGCQVVHRSYHWTAVPKIGEESCVLFEFEEEFAAND